jgi:hypothetical protein
VRPTFPTTPHRKCIAENRRLAASRVTPTTGRMSSCTTVWHRPRNSVSSFGWQGNAGSEVATISADGEFAAFGSRGGDLLLVPERILLLDVRWTGITLVGQVPDQSWLCGIEVFLQVLEIDPGAEPPAVQSSAVTASACALRRFFATCSGAMGTLSEGSLITGAGRGRTASSPGRRSRTSARTPGPGPRRSTG